jgi:hypothetical protein
VGCVGQRLLEDCGDAIGGDHIKSHARTDHDSSGLSILLAALRGDKDLNRVPRRVGENSQIISRAMVIYSNDVVWRPQGEEDDQHSD